MKKNINVLLVSSKYMPEYAGSGLRAHNQYKRLTEKYPEIKVQVLCGSESENRYSDYEHDGFKVKRIASKPYPLPGNGVMRFLKIAVNFQSEFSKTKLFLNSLQEEPDLIHVFGKNYVTAAAVNYASEREIPLFVELCNEMKTPWQYIPFPHKFMISGKFPPWCQVICISEHLRSMCQENGIPEDRIWCRPNPIDETRFYHVDRETKSALKKELTRFSEKDTLIVYIANYRPSKNHEFLLDVIKELPENFKLYLGGPIVGSGPRLEEHKKLYERLVKKVNDENLSERVEIHSGFCDNVENFYRAADVYAFPTLQEGLGTPMLESIACGTPVVANMIPGATDVWIKNGENGFLPELKPGVFAEKILEASSFPEEKMNGESLKILEKAGTNVIDNEYYNLIKKLTGN